MIAQDRLNLNIKVICPAEGWGGAEFNSVTPKHSVVSLGKYGPLMESEVIN